MLPVAPASNSLSRANVAPVVDVVKKALLSGLPALFVLVRLFHVSVFPIAQIGNLAMVIPSAFTLIAGFIGRSKLPAFSNDPKPVYPLPRRLVGRSASAICCVPKRPCNFGLPFLSDRRLPVFNSNRRQLKRELNC